MKTCNGLLKQFAIIIHQGGRQHLNILSLLLGLTSPPTRYEARPIHGTWTVGLWFWCWPTVGAIFLGLLSTRCNDKPLATVFPRAKSCATTVLGLSSYRIEKIGAYMQE